MKKYIQVLLLTHKVKKKKTELPHELKYKVLKISELIYYLFFDMKYQLFSNKMKVQKFYHQKASSAQYACTNNSHRNKQLYRSSSKRIFVRSNKFN